MEKINFNIQESLGYHFNILFIKIKKAMETKLRPYNLTHLQFGILINIYKNNVTTQKELLKYTYGDEASITRLIDRLEAKKYLQRVQSSEDKRKKKIELTQSGVELTENLIICATEVNKELVNELNTSEAKELLELVKKVQFSFGDN